MRKSILFAIAPLAILSVACVKETAPEEQKPSDNPNVVVFTAPAPKTTIDANDKVVSWTAGDVVKFVWDGGSDTATASTTGAETTFTVEVPSSITELYAVYPASAAADDSYDDGKVNVTFPSSITDGSFAANDICVAKAVKDGSWDTTLAFKNVACIMKVGITDSAITKIQVMGGRTTDEAIAISGTLPVSMDGSGNPVFGTATSTGKTVTLTISGPGNYYIPILPDVNLSDGFRIGVFKGNEQLTPFFYNGSYTTARGKILKFPEIDSHAGQYYVTPSGGAERQTGQSWTSAMGVDEFKAFVTDEDNHFLLKGATFHFSADEFSFGDNYLVLNYPHHSNVAFTLEGTVTASDTTTFVGRTALSGTTAGVLWPQANSYLTVKNIKFTGTNGASNASPIRVNNGAVELNLDHCYFRGNQTSVNGGGISVFNGATVNITDCSFSGATGMGGIIHVNNASAKVNITDTEAKGITKNAIYAQAFDDFKCTRVAFKGNNDTGSTINGAAAYVSGEGTILFDDCDFIKNHSTTKGGAVCITGTDVTATFKDSEFTNNYSDKMGGAVMIESGNTKTTFTGGMFQGNHADGVDNTDSAGGVIYATGDGVTFACNDVLFKSNYSNVGDNEYSGGIIRVESATGKATFDGCTFDGNHGYRITSGTTPNPSCAAIVNNRTVDGPTYYFNACEFMNNATGTYAGVGAKYGMVFGLYNETTLAFNNCSIHDNYGKRDTNPIDWIFVNNTDIKLILSNSSVIGDPSRRTSGTGSVSKKNGLGVIYFDKDAEIYFINNILCSPTDGCSLNCNVAITIENSYFNKTSPVYNKTCNWGTDTGSGHDYYASSSYFHGWSAPYTWDGTISDGTNKNMKAATADVNDEIEDADASFYAWLVSIEALGKDINGNSRGATSWPGCYQSN